MRTRSPRKGTEDAADAVDHEHHEAEETLGGQRHALGMGRKKWAIPKY